MKKFRKDFLIFILLTLLVAVLQYFILKPHLRYGFADVDWIWLLAFKEASIHYQNPLNHFIQTLQNQPLYAYQTYYMGLIEKFFGMDYINFHIITHIFKFVATISIYPVIFLITKSRLAAFLTVLIYAVAYPAVGVMYTAATSALFIAILVMSVFFVWYFLLLHKEKNSILDIVITLVLFFVTIILAPERMYPLIPAIALIELYWGIKNRQSKIILSQIFKRASSFIIVFLVIYLYKPSAFTLTSYTGTTMDIYRKFMEGNWHLLLNPLIAFGSLFVPREGWKYFGNPNIDTVSSYLGFFITGPFIFFAITTILLSFLTSYKLRFILEVLGITFILSLLVYFLAHHQIYIPEEIKRHFDPGTIIPALIGSFVLAFCFGLFHEWLDGKFQDSLIISMVGVITLSFIYIVLTWVAADWILIFTGVHRYLTIPAIASSLFLAGIITLTFNKLRSIKVTQHISFSIFLILIPLIMFNTAVIGDYFKYELEYAGTDAAGHIRMKNKLWSYLTNFSNTEPSLFYFDESQDHDNGYFDETTIMAGFSYWMRFRGRDIVDVKLTPALLRSNLICSEVRSTCLSKVKELVTVRNEEKGIFYGNVFYKKENFYAFRFINKDLVNIREEVIRIIGLES